MSFVPPPSVTGLFPRPIRRSPANHAVAHQDLAALREALDAGADVEEAQFGTSLLHHAVDVEGDGAAQTRTPLHVDLTAFLLARGADPTRRSAATGLTAEDVAMLTGHWLATELFDAWKRERNR
ncbi:ankyrin repeat domain-containing protein [Streptomyces sp. DSM 44915]|uniref:Ankyrin repeat domain-containing protein n=1 Tax=Streptomyces chisholmiae TaxID=3075540 RepID=A0ABU2JR19_9ACTN|nr:ankyrin repeat domain-containing protein [Streptomyces sp. DSM 44915]MDT0267423.1 ankyrin repeat domain-containing protein [Streptomyces sp. DSM 44915]